MDWLQHLLPKTSDFLYSYAPALEPSALDVDEAETNATEAGSAEALEGSNTPAGHEDSVGHLQTNAADVGFLANLSQPSLHNPAPDEREQGPINKSFESKFVLEKMLKHVIPGARYNSSARYPPPRCCPGTRAHILNDVGTRIRDKDTRIIWLFGPAGCGKTAVMQTLAETYSSNVTSATLFLSRDLRDDPNRIFTTLAYDFAVANPAYRRFIEGEMALDPDILSLSMIEQFKRLFIQPFLEYVIPGTQRWVIFLDGLDECRSYRDQCKFLELIRDSVLSHPQSMSLLWVISSRPEAHLGVSFSKIKESLTCFWQKEISINSLDASEDVKQYIETELMKIRELYGHSIPTSSNWPLDDELHKLSDTSSGFFCFASSMMQYVAGASPVSRLKYISSPDRPLQPLDLMYTQIMSNIPTDVLPDTKTLLGFYVLQQMFSIGYPPNLWDVENIKLGFLTVCNILGMEQHRAYTALRQLPSVLFCPSPESAEDSDIKFFHHSFLQFLRDGSRSGTYCIDIGGEVNKIWHRYFTILEQVKQSPSADSVDIYWPPHDEKSHRELQQTLFRISMRGWILILIQFYHEYRCGCLKAASIELQFSRPLTQLPDHLGSIMLDCAEIEIGSFINWVSRHQESRKAISVRENYGGESKVIKLLRTARQCCRVVQSKTTGISVSLEYKVLTPKLEIPRVSGWIDADDAWKACDALSELVELNKSGTSLRAVTIEMAGYGRTVLGPFTGRDPLGDVYYVFPRQ